MNLRRSLFAAAALAAFAAAPAVAQDIEAQKGYKCKSKYIEANWMIILYNGGKSNYCEATIDKNGKIGASVCFQNKQSNVIGDISGKLKLAKHCAISGTITFNPSKGKSESGDVEFYMDSAATSFVGVLSSDADDGEFDVVQAIRMK